MSKFYFNNRAGLNGLITLGIMLQIVGSVTKPLNSRYYRTCGTKLRR